MNTKVSLIGIVIDSANGRARFLSGLQSRRCEKSFYMLRIFESDQA